MRFGGNMEKKSSQKTRAFFKKNVYYIIMAVCLLAIAAMITVSVLVSNGTIGNKNDQPTLDNNEPVIKPDEGKPGEDNVPGKKPDDLKPDQPKPDQPKPDEHTAIVFGNPVDKINVIQDYSMTALVWNSTLKHYAVHNGIDFGGDEKTQVKAVYDGVVTDVSYDVLNGHQVTIKHNDELSTVYSSLSEPVVKKGDKINKGMVLGSMSQSATNEYALGCHVHITVLKQGEAVDPNTYFTFSQSK